MAIVLPGWLTENENRNYPLHDYASKQPVDGGRLMPDGMLVDANILVPATAGRYVYVSSMAVTPGIVSLTLLATDIDPFGETPSSSSSSSSSSEIVPLAVLSVQRPVTIYKNYAVQALYPGVAGWVAFGSDVEEYDNYSARFTDPAASLLVARAARGYRDYPVQTLGKLDRLAELTGLIQLVASGDVVINDGVRTINGLKREVITIGLDLSLTPEDILRKYAGTCGERPEDGTCERGKAFTFINGVGPDCNGNVDIVFEGLDVIQTEVEHGQVVDLPVGLDDVCPTFDPERYDPHDLCESSSSPSSSSSSSPSSSSSSSSSSPSPAPPPEEYFDDFSDPVYTLGDGTHPGMMVPVTGIWYIDDVEPSEATVGISRLFSAQTNAPTIITVPTIYKSDVLGYRVFSTIRPFTELSNGHVIFGYKGDDDFWYAGLSLQSQFAATGKLYVGHKTGDLGSPLDNWPEGLEYGYQFDSDGGPNLDAGLGIISPDGIYDSDVRVVVTVTPLSGELKNVKVEWYWNRSGQGFPNPTTPFNTAEFVTGFDLSGFCGVGAIGYETHYDNFAILNLV